jgi:predicted phage baseplate assembly protein
LFGAELALAVLSQLLQPGQELAVRGRRQRLCCVVDDAALSFAPDGAAAVPLASGDSFVVAAPPAELVGGAETVVSPPDLPVLLQQGTAVLRWRLIDRDGAVGILDAPADAVALQAALEDDPVVHELCAVAKSAAAVSHDRDRTTVVLTAPLVHVFDRTTTTVCANVVRATHGEGVSEIAGSGDAAAAGQQFTLRQSPLTYISAATTDGRRSTLSVRVNGLQWDEVPTLFEQPATAHVYALRQDSDGRTIVQFGDGVEGARLSSGADNVRFTYRKNLGLAGNLPAGRLTTLLGRPLGVKTVTSVTSAAGGDDPEGAEALRRNAPLTTLTLGRAVSLKDYADFARSFAGIAKAETTWSSRGILLTVTGPGGAVTSPDAIEHLTASLREYGDPLVPLFVQNYRSVAFRLKATLKIAAAALTADAIEAVESALRTHFGFDARQFGQAVSVDEVMAVMHGVIGLEGANVTELYRLDPGAVPGFTARLFAYPAEWQPDDTVSAAELLTLDPGPVSLEVMA